MFHSFRVSDSHDEAPGGFNQEFELLLVDLQDAVAYWRLDDLSGTDNSGRGNDLTKFGSPVLEAGIISDNAVTFNDPSHNLANYFEMDATADVTLTSGDISVAGWVYMKSTNADHGPWTKWIDGSSSSNDWVMQYSGAAWAPRIVDTSGENPGDTPLNTWTFIAFTFVDSTGVWNTRVDSTDFPRIGGNTPGIVNSTGDANKMSVGKLSTINNQWMWDGRVQGLGIWKRALSSVELDSLYNSGAGIHVF